ncbi:MAG TPA: 50S ribosomal protein L10 [Candidatus Tectomicrobia bacterium]|nr:50S ribosomal protein L10 [Candidatus Tectomicrobia bacterium]
MAVTKAEKAAQVAELEQAFRSAGTAVLVDFRGLNVPDVTELRRQVRAARAHYRVVKNTLARRALAGTPFEPLAPYFDGTTAVAWSGDDPVALARTLVTFAKEKPALAIKAAVVQGRTLGPAEVGELATLPGRPELYARLLGVLQAPLAGLVRVLAAAPRDLLSVLVQVERRRAGES